MEFFAANGKRPRRLSEQTRRFAYDSLHYKYGRETASVPGVSLDDTEGFESLSRLEQYDAAILRIAQEAPIRICEHEKISGAATLGIALQHNIPALYRDKCAFSTSISHFTPDFETVLRKGVDFIRQQVRQSMLHHENTTQEAFLQSCLHCLDALELWHGRYLEALAGKPEYEENLRALQRVPFQPPTDFREAVQSLWFVFAFLRLCGNWPGIGRIDLLLGEYLTKDLAEGAITLDEARELLAHFFIKGCEWIRGGNYGSGDAQHYQNILLAGVDEDGKEITNQVTYLVLDVLEELGIGDFPTTVRVNQNTPHKLLRRVAEVIRLGGGVLAIYNEDLILDSLTEYGYPLKEARKFANDGCWEVQIPGKTYFIYHPIDALQILQTNTLEDYCTRREYPDFEDLLQEYLNQLRSKVGRVIRRRNEGCFQDTNLPVDQWVWKRNTPCTVVSLFEQGCIEKGLSYLEGGPIYNVYSPHIGGLPDAANSLYAIQKLVYEEKKLSLGQLMDCVKNNWEGQESLRLSVQNKYSYYGNDNDEVDLIARRILEAFADACDEEGRHSAYKTPAGVSTFGRQLEWAPQRLATCYGKKAHEILAGNFSPTPGTDKEGATAIIRSYCKSDLKRTVTGAALDLKLLPSTLRGEEGPEVLIGLIQGFVRLGGYFFQPDVADEQLLRDAQRHPEKYPTLSVRVSGWNARFITLDHRWQTMVIEQMKQE